MSRELDDRRNDVVVVVDSPAPVQGTELVELVLVESARLDRGGDPDLDPGFDQSKLLVERAASS